MILIVITYYDSLVNIETRSVIFKILKVERLDMIVNVTVIIHIIIYIYIVYTRMFRHCIELLFLSASVNFILVL